LTTISSQQELRRQALSQRAALTTEQRMLYSGIIASRFHRSAEFFSAQSIACFISVGDEVDTSMIFERAWTANKQIFAPVVGPHGMMRFIEVTRNSELKKSAYGLWEPVSGEEILPTRVDVVVTPVVAFDSTGHRIGVGGGYYDRTFTSLQRQKSWRHPKLVGFAFNCQKVEKIRPNPWDIPLYRVLTEAS
jgi:5-formyltetrahydrofolate cyclo-ligase